MLEFEPFSLPALRRVLPYLRQNPSLCSDLSAGYLFLWQEGAKMGFCVRDDTLVIRQNIGDQPAFSYPIGANPDRVIDELKEYALNRRLPLRFYAVDGATLDKIRGDRRLQPAAWAYDRKWSDYVYSFADAATFPGKKYAGQRNHVNKFRKLYGEPDIRFLTPYDLPDVEAFLDEYGAEHTDALLLEQTELKRTKELCNVYPALGLLAAGLFVSGKLAAISIGEVVGDSLLIHVEKALTRYEGIYPTVFSGFVRLIRDRLGRDLSYVNREDDSGDPGLRISKTQYHPILMADKYLVHVGSPATKTEPACTLHGEKVVLTEIRESDKEAYLKLNLDVENNRYWDYDYREDPAITGPIDENTFYDSVVYDMRAGDSINFAVRLTPDGEMIGETILWNFTFDGGAELGCRILPAFQGKGYGKDAFGTTADYAVGRLERRVTARCRRENEASRRMILACGFSQADADDRYFYFQNRKEKTK